MQFSTYNGWENKFTWLVHLHLSNEVELANEMAELVAQEPNDVPAGRLVGDVGEGRARKLDHIFPRSQ